MKLAIDFAANSPLNHLIQEILFSFHWLEIDETELILKMWTRRTRLLVKYFTELCATFFLQNTRGSWLTKTTYHLWLLTVFLFFLRILVPLFIHTSSFGKWLIAFPSVMSLISPVRVMFSSSQFLVIFQGISYNFNLKNEKTVLKLKFLVSSQAHYGEDMQEKIDGHCKYN